MIILPEDVPIGTRVFLDGQEVDKVLSISTHDQHVEILARVEPNGDIVSRYVRGQITIQLPDIKI